MWMGEGARIFLLALKDFLPLLFLHLPLISTRCVFHTAVRVLLLKSESAHVTPLLNTLWGFSSPSQQNPQSLEWPTDPSLGLSLVTSLFLCYLLPSFNPDSLFSNMSHGCPLKTCIRTCHCSVYNLPVVPHLPQSKSQNLYRTDIYKILLFCPSKKSFSSLPCFIAFFP